MAGLTRVGARCLDEAGGVRRIGNVGRRRPMTRFALYSFVHNLAGIHDR